MPERAALCSSVTYSHQCTQPTSAPTKKASFVIGTHSLSAAALIVDAGTVALGLRRYMCIHFTRRRMCASFARRLQACTGSTWLVWW